MSIVFGLVSACSREWPGRERIMSKAKSYGTYIMAWLPCIIDFITYPFPCCWPSLPLACLSSAFPRRRRCRCRQTPLPTSSRRGSAGVGAATSRASGVGDHRARGRRDSPSEWTCVRAVSQAGQRLTTNRTLRYTVLITSNEEWHFILLNY